jgi:hypothetical protein
MMVIAFYIARVEATLNLPLSSVHLRERRAVLEFDIAEL